MGKLGSSTERRVLAKMVREPEAILDSLTCRGVGAVVLDGDQQCVLKRVVIPHSSLMAVVPVKLQAHPRDAPVPGQMNIQGSVVAPSVYHRHLKCPRFPKEPQGTGGMK